MANRTSIAKRAYEDYRRSNMHRLEDAYTSYSPAKGAAWDYCRRLCYENNGHGLKVIATNTFTFSAGFEYEDAETGVCMFMYITKAYDTPVEV